LEVAWFDREQYHFSSHDSIFHVTSLLPQYYREHQNRFRGTTDAAAVLVPTTTAVFHLENNPSLTKQTATADTARGRRTRDRKLALAWNIFSSKQYPVFKRFVTFTSEEHLDPCVFK